MQHGLAMEQRKNSHLRNLMELCSVAQEPKIFELVGEAKMLAKLRLVTRVGD